MFLAVFCVVCASMLLHTMYSCIACMPRDAYYSSGDLIMTSQDLLAEFQRAAISCRPVAISTAICKQARFPCDYNQIKNLALSAISCRMHDCLGTNPGKHSTMFCLLFRLTTDISS